MSNSATGGVDAHALYADFARGGCDLVLACLQFEEGALDERLNGEVEEKRIGGKTEAGQQKISSNLHKECAEGKESGMQSWQSSL